MAPALGLLGVLLSLAVGNIRSDPAMDQPDVVQDTGALVELGPAVVCGNEIAPPRYRRAWDRLTGAAGYRTYGGRTENPVAVRAGLPRSWRVDHHRVRFLHGGVTHVSPDRTATVVVLSRPRGRVAVVCTHLISRAWTHVEATTGLRQRLWLQARDRIRGIVRYWTGRGVPVVVAGDLNRPATVHWCRAQLVLANLGLIQVTACPGRHQEAERAPGAVTVGTEKLATDHPLVRRVVRLEAVASRP